MVFCATQGIVDYMIWGYPFAEMYGYVTYNLDEGTRYVPNSNYAMYLLVLIGAFFPVGILMMVGFFRTYKKYLILFLPVLLFIIFHTIYPNRQERFILTILPAFVILGVIGFEAVRAKPIWEKGWKYCSRIFWIFNIPLMLAACITYSKKSRVEAMYAIYENELKPERVLLEATGESSCSMLPRFYAQRWDFTQTRREFEEDHPLVNQGLTYDLIFFYDDSNLAERVSLYDTIYPKMERIKICEPSYADQLLHWLNPKNQNEYIEVWETHARDSL
jgi:hypothetical protein